MEILYPEVQLITDACTGFGVKLYTDWDLVILRRIEKFNKKPSFDVGFPNSIRLRITKNQYDWIEDKQSWDSYIFTDHVKERIEWTLVASGTKVTDKKDFGTWKCIEFEDIGHTIKVGVRPPNFIK